MSGAGYTFTPGQMTVEQAGWYLSVSKRRVEEMLEAGELIASAEGGKRVIQIEELDRHRKGLPEWERRTRSA